MVKCLMCSFDNKKVKEKNKCIGHLSTNVLTLFQMHYIAIINNSNAKSKYQEKLSTTEFSFDII